MLSRRSACLGLASCLVSPVGTAAAAARSPQRYSYFSPSKGTVNLELLGFEPRQFQVVGRQLPTGFFVLTGLSRTLAKLARDGQVLWQLDVSGGGGAYALGQFKNRLIVGFNREVLVVDAQTGHVTQRISMPTRSGEPINFLRVQGDTLILGDSSGESTLQFYKLRLNGRGNIQATEIGSLRTKTQYPRDAIFIAQNRLAVADTFGHAVVLFDFKSKWRERRRLYEYYPNMLGYADGQLEVLSEHGNRLVRLDLQTGERLVRIACPHPLFMDASTTPQQILTEEPATITGESPPRQICAADVAGNQTLYAANGFFDNGAGQVWVADADNHRVALFVDGTFWGAISGVNHPIRVIPVM